MSRWSSRLRALRDYQKNLGTLCGLHWYVLQSLDTHGRLGAPVGVRPARLSHKVLLRMGDSSDQDVFWQIFLKNEYAFIESLPDVRTVIDLGANIGLASALFLSRWPAANVLAVEPDPDNFAMLTKNLAAYGQRVQALQAAAWVRSGELELSRSFGDGREWARAVQERAGDGEHVRAFGMPDLLERVPGGRVDLLKIDIEGSESALFSGDTSWLDRVRHIAIELHGPSCAQAFRAGMRRYSWQESTCGEYLVCRDLHRDRHAANAAVN